MSERLRIGIIGGNGWLGGAIARAVVGANLVPAESLTLSFRSGRPGHSPAARWTKDNQGLADQSDVIIVSVRPGDWPSLAIDAGGKLAVSVMAGIPLARLVEQLKTKRVVRSLPNAAAEVGKSYTPWVPSADVDDDDRAIIRRIFEACGTADEVSNEADIDYLTGLTGSGPAFPALLAAAMMDDAMARGLQPDVARRAVNAVLVGTGRLTELRDESPADVVEAFVNYRGTTAAAIKAMRDARFDAAVRSGLAEALRKSIEMGRGS